MRRFIAIILLILPVTSMSAQSYHAINIDAKTVAAMTAAYAIEEETERKTASDVDSILGHYTKASLSTAGIYLSKLKDRNAMREVGVFGSDENYYYQRILYLVKDGIMPKLIVVAAKMVKQPDNALYWGPYLFKTTKNVEQLCKQFELVVTNGKLSFKDVTFLVINEKLQKVFDLAQLGNVNWKELLEKVGDFNIKAAKEDIKNDIGKLGGVLSTAGKGVVDSNMRDFSAIGRIFKSKPSEIYQLYQTFRSKYESIRNAGNVKAILMGVIGSNSADAVSRLFQVDNYSITGYVSNYIKELQGQHYKQRWYIYSDDSGSKVLCDYKPKAEANYDDKWNGWLHFVSPRDNEYCHVLTSSEMVSAKTESERLAGWNQAKVDKYNKEHPGHHATITYVLQHENRRESYKHGWGARHYKRHCFYAYSIKIVDSWSIKHEVHEEIFDSESMDEETFRKRMESQLKYWNSLESDKPFLQRVTYKLGNDARKYYTIADENKMKGCNSVVFLAKCDDGATLAEGSFNWKENGNQGKHLEDPKSKNFALDKTQVSTNGANELQQKKKGYQDEIKSLENQIRSMDKQMSSLISQMNQAKMAHDNNKVAALRAQYDTVSNNQAALKRQLSQVQSNLAQIDNAIAEYYKDLNEDNGSPYRINSNMRELESLFQLSWRDAGEWVNGDGQYTFVRHAYCAQVKSQVTYTAVLKLQSKPKHFLGIRIHRAILSVDYKLSAAYSAENVIETMNLDMSLSEKERAAKVNERQKQLMEDMPDCSITVRYNYARNMPNEEGSDAIHLLWASDRLDVARDVEYQLSVIYSQLVLLEKVMNDRQTIKDFLTNQLLNPITRKSRGTIAEYALGRWTDASDKAKKASSSPTSQKAKP
ncbi:hypothetical protein KZY59_10795 [Prevotella buccae]|uniref:hypothetical protein n=1 Tax=Segatella buccae TaxID=28126 RepID=UPI001C5F9D60|nr:hypothetical protein [Segatella buccae]MBW4872017.1 hypothetical protein [Segatella buccae]